MNRDGCRNCKHKIHTGAAHIMRCERDNEMVDGHDTCSNWELKRDAIVLEDEE